MLSNPSATIEHILKPIARWYRRGDVEEVFQNRFQEVVLKMRDGSWQTHADPALDRDYLYNRLCRVLANLNRSPINVENPGANTIPIVSCQIPGESFRFQAVLGSKVLYERTNSEGIALAIRALSTQELDFDDFGLVEGKPLHSATKYTAQSGRYSDDPLTDLICTLKNNQGVIVSGPTSTGKTSFTQRVIKQIPLDRRVVTVEDTHELDVPHHNHVHLLGPRNKGAQGMGYNEILDAVVRLTPDVLIGGELSITNASAFLRIMTTGHANFITTIHADSPMSALRAFVQNIARNNEPVDYEMTVDVICGSIGRIVQLGRADGMRRVTAIEIPANMNRRQLKEYIAAPAAA